jgi:hypothetical protein
MMVGENTWKFRWKPALLGDAGDLVAFFLKVLEDAGIA